MIEWLYFKVAPDFAGGHLPANRELVGLYVGYPEEMRCHIFRYPATTTIHMDLMYASYTTYEECKAGPAYKGQTSEESH